VPKIVDAAEQRGEIRRAARRVFARRGISETGLGAVAEAAGMGRSSLYHYYPDKASLVRDLARDLLDEEEALFAALAEGQDSPLERICRLVETLTRAFAQWADIGRILLELWSSDARRFRPLFRRIRRDLAIAIEEGQRRGEVDPALRPELCAAAIVGVVDGLLLQHFVDTAAFSDVDALCDEVVRVTRKALAA